MKRIGGCLEDWMMVDYYTSIDAEPCSVVYGRIYKDDKYIDGDTIMTSKIESIKGGKVFTKNTIYTLGREYGA